MCILVLGMVMMAQIRIQRAAVDGDAIYLAYQYSHTLDLPQ